LHLSTPIPPIDLTVTSLQPGTYRLLVHRTGFQANDPYSQYIDWGSPKDVTPTQIEALQKISDDTPETDVMLNIAADGTFHRKIPIRTNDVILANLSRMQ
jgi:xylan 1,4-beta-xylosidase